MKDFLKEYWPPAFACIVGLIFLFGIYFAVTSDMERQKQRQLYDEQHCVVWGFPDDSYNRRCACYDVEKCAQHVPAQMVDGK